MNNPNTKEPTSTPVTDFTLPNPPLNEEDKKLCKTLARVFAGIYTRTEQQWEDGFRIDHLMEQELAIWRRILTAFQYFTVEFQMSPEEKRDCFKLLLSAASCGLTRALKHVKLRALSKWKAKAIIDKLMASAV